MVTSHLQVPANTQDKLIDGAVVIDLNRVSIGRAPTLQSINDNRDPSALDEWNFEQIAHAFEAQG
jgi:hypothetical protein